MDWLKEHVFEVIAGALGALGAWFTLKSRVDHLSEKIIAQHKLLSEMAETIKSIGDKMIVMDKAMVVVVADYDSLSSRTDKTDKELEFNRTRIHDLIDEHISPMQAKLYFLEKKIG